MLEDCVHPMGLSSKSLTAKITLSNFILPLKRIEPTDPIC